MSGMLQDVFPTAMIALCDGPDVLWYAACRASKQIQLYLEFQVDKLETQQQTQQLVGRLAGGQVAVGTLPTQQRTASIPAPTSTAAAGKGPKQQQQQQPKSGTIMACWGKAVSVATAVTAAAARSPAKGNRGTESQQSPSTQ